MNNLLMTDEEFMEKINEFRKIVCSRQTEQDAKKFWEDSEKILKEDSKND